MPTDYAKDLRRTLVKMQAERDRLDHAIAGLHRTLAHFERITAPQANASGAARGDTRGAIVGVLEDGRPRRAADIADAIGKDRPAVTAALVRMVNLGLVAKPSRGVYQLAGAAPAALTLEDRDE